MQFQTVHILTDLCQTFINVLMMKTLKKVKTFINMFYFLN